MESWNNDASNPNQIRLGESMVAISEHEDEENSTVRSSEGKGEIEIQYNIKDYFKIEECGCQPRILAVDDV